MHCLKCGSEVVEGAIFCHKCGARLEPTDRTADQTASDTAGDNVGPVSETPPLGREEETLGSASTPVEKFREMATARQNTSDEPERELWRGGYSSKAMIGSWLLSIAITVGLIVLAVWAWTTWVTWSVVGAVLLLWLYQAVVLGYRRLNVRYRLTTIRFIHETGILRRVTDRIETIDMTDIAFEQGLLERLVGVGSIRILSSDRSHPELALRGIEDVKMVSALIDDVRCKERRRRGLHIDQ